MKYIPLLLASCVAVSANAATFNAQGKIINSKDAKNPGIVKFEKNKATTAKSNINKPSALAKVTPIGTVDHVSKVWAMFNTNTNKYHLNGNMRSETNYFSAINNFEANDTPRNSYSKINYTHSQAQYPSKSGSCTVVSKADNESYYSHRELTFDMLHVGPLKRLPNGGIVQKDCSRAEATNTCGAGINIYNIVADNPITFSGNNCSTSNVAYNYKYGIQHYYSNSVLKGISPNATVTPINEGSARATRHYVTRPQNPYRNEQHIGNSITSTTTNVTLYNDEAAEQDNYIYHNRVIEFAPFSINGQRTGAGISLNAISVGATNDDLAVLLPNQARPKFANKQGAEYTKPEIYVPAYTYNSEYDYTKGIKHDGNTVDFRAASDGWGASTIAAGMAADLLSKYPFYKWHPEVVKALMLTAYNPGNHIIKVNTDNIYQFNYSMLNNATVLPDKNMPLFDEMVRNNVSRYWYGNNGDFFNSDETYSFNETVEAGAQYNIAIAWLVSGRYANEARHLSSNYQLRILNNQTGALIAQTTSSAGLATFRQKSITVPAGVTQLKIEIKRTRNTGDRVILGYNMHKVTP
ncbi:hypothetical protein [Fibrobacter succinogenes]|uniref:hypothetical protein n=1 Tax=Fibrobacter succinogenes TaxID=833 RepID=UPI0015680B91|nr:hypothetical protein [Fibrobacter succinogenes]